MKITRKIWIIGAALILVIGFGLWETFNQPTIGDLPGDFEEVAFVRNEQNKGGIVRVYAVTVGDVEGAAYDACADMFPTNDYASVTKIYFFDKQQPYPSTLSLEEPHYDNTRYKAVRILTRTGSN